MGNYLEETIGLYEKVIDIFHNKFYIITIEIFSFHLAHLRIIGSIEYGIHQNYYFRVNSEKFNYYYFTWINYILDTFDWIYMHLLFNLGMISKVTENTIPSVSISSSSYAFV